MAKGGKGGGGSGGGGSGGGGGGKGKVKNLTLEGTAGDDFLFAGNGSDTLTGLDGNDSLFGLEGDDILDGGSGNDQLEAGFGDDLVLGGSGDDYLTGNLGSDTLDGGSMSGEYNIASFENIGSVDDTDTGITLTAGADAGSYTSTNATADGPDDIDTLTNIHRVVGSNFNDVMTGGSSADTFWGADGADTIEGGAGNDTIYGGTDNDVLSGDDGNDTFVFLRVADGLTALPGTDEDAGYGDGSDFITDFTLGEDRLVFLSNEAFDFDTFSATYDAGSDQTTLTYQAEADYFGPSQIVLAGEFTLDELVDPTTDLLVDPNFHFDI